MSPSIPSLDHLILFLPVSPSHPSPTIPPSLSQSFTLYPGGTHADNITANTLILLADGCYIELICFLPQPAGSDAVKNHWWGPSSDRIGWTDWCLTNSLSPTQNHEIVKETHGNPVQGGRKRPDGKEVKWSVTFPKGDLGGQSTRGKVPFFCHDTTPRELRVPGDQDKLSHANGVLGVQSITVVVKDQELLDDVSKVYGNVLGVEGLRSGEEVTFEIGRVKQVKELGSGPKIVLRLPSSEEEAAKTVENRFWFGEVVLSAQGGNYKQSGLRERVDTDKDVGGVWIQYL